MKGDNLNLDPTVHGAKRLRSRNSAPSAALRALTAVVLLATLSSTGCRQDMHDQPKYQPFEQSRFFADARAARPLPEGTVARGHLRSDALLYTGKIDGKPAAVFPMQVTRNMLERGRERYDIYCAPCHDRVGSGQGMVVRRGYSQPPSLHGRRLRKALPGYLFKVISEGLPLMPAYNVQIPVSDRWAIVAYIRALQLSQHATLAEVPPQHRQLLEAGHE